MIRERAQAISVWQKGYNSVMDKEFAHFSMVLKTEWLQIMASIE